MDESELVDALEIMEADPRLVTESAYRANTAIWPKNRISFVDSHIAYLKAHPTTNPRHYLSNLRLMLRKKP